MLKHWRDTHLLEGWSVILVSGSDLPKNWKGLTSWRGGWSFLSVDLICWNTGKGLTTWRGGQTFLSLNPICQNTGEGLTFWRVVSHSCQWIWSAKILERHSQTGGWSAILVNRSDLLKHWRGTYKLEELSVIIVSRSNLLKHWRGTHKLEGWSAILVSGSNLLKLERDSLSGGVVSHSCQWIWSAETLERDSLSIGWSAILVSGSDLPKHWRGTHKLEGWSVDLIGWNVGEGTHSLDGWSTILVSGSDLLNTGERLTS